MGVAESLRRKRIYKLLILLLKIIPMLLALSVMLRMFFDFFGVESQIFTFIGGVSFLPVVFIYLASYAFQFCEYHRMFLHYTVAATAINCVDYYIGIPISNWSFFVLHLTLIGLLLFLVLYFYKKQKCCRR